MKNDIGRYFNLFIDKVLVSTINNDRRHLKLDVIFNFKRNNEEIEYNDNSYKITISKGKGNINEF